MGSLEQCVALVKINSCKGFIMSLSKAQIQKRFTDFSYWLKENLRETIIHKQKAKVQFKKSMMLMMETIIVMLT